MGDHKIDIKSDDQARISFLGHLLDDLRSLEYMFQHGMIEDDVIRIGAEQEFCLVDERWRPATNAVEILKEVNDDHFTTELARYNLEINLDPVELRGDAFTKIEDQVKSLLQKATEVADRKGSKILLTGILPSISGHELDIDYMTPGQRYYALNDMLKEARGEHFRVQFSCVDELSIMHNSVMFEACNTSFQLHLQVTPAGFRSSYNWAQAIAGPVLGACVNSPLLLGKELWSETRIALFQQSIDTRAMSMAQTSQQARVSFGRDWLRGDIIDFYKNEISEFSTILTKEIKQSSFEELQSGNIPKLRALNLHNGTIYKWNRPCYGVGNGKPHIRIENRYIPSGPTLTDEMANFAFWVGLMKGRPAEYNNLPGRMDFEDAKSNFIRAARTGSEAMMHWMGRVIPLDQLVTEELIPLARTGLKLMNIDENDADRYLNVIKSRLSTHTGSQWMIKNYRNLKRTLKPHEATIALTEAIYNNQQSMDKVSEWPTLQKFTTFKKTASRVGHIMTSNLVTANATDIGLLTLQYMKWNSIHHLPVVNNDQTLVGLITWQHLKKYWDEVHDPGNSITAREIMVTDVRAAETTMRIKEAIVLMKEQGIGCLPVVHDSKLVGIVTTKDLIPFDND